MSSVTKPKTKAKAFVPSFTRFTPPVSTRDKIVVVHLSKNDVVFLQVSSDSRSLEYQCCKSLSGFNHGNWEDAYCDDMFSNCDTDAGNKKNLVMAKALVELFSV